MDDERRATGAMRTRIAMRGLAACLAVAATAAAGAPAQPDAAPPVIQVAGMVVDFGAAPSLYRDAAGRKPAPKEAHEADDDVAPGRVQARASSAASTTASDAEVSTLSLWLAGLGAMLFVAWRLKGD